MLNNPVKLVGLAAGLATAAPFSFPLQNGFPTPSNDSVSQIAIAAGGTLSNGPPPPKIDPDTLNSFRLIAFNEIFEVAFFTELISNITQGVPGYEIPPDALTFTVDSLLAVQTVSDRFPTSRTIWFLIASIARGTSRPQRQRRLEAFQCQPHSAMPV